MISINQLYGKWNKKNPRHHTSFIYGSATRAGHGDFLSKRYKLVETIEKARLRNEEYDQSRLEMEKEIKKQKGDSYQITSLNVKYNFEWKTPSKDYSYLYHYSKNIKEDWLALLKECEQMLIEDVSMVIIR